MSICLLIARAAHIDTGLVARLAARATRQPVYLPYGGRAASAGRHDRHRHGLARP